MMKQKTYIGLLIAMLWMSVGANAQNYQVNIESTSNGQISASPSTGLSKGTTVSLTATASEGYKLTSLKVYRYSDTNRAQTRTEIPVGEELTLTKVTSNKEYTFEMPDDDVNITATFGEDIKQEVKTEESGVTVATANVTDDIVKEAEVTQVVPDNEGVATIPESVGDYTVTSVADNAFAGKTEVTDIHLPDTEEPITLGENALKIDDNHVATIHTPLALLDDYATNKQLEQNVEAGKLVATVTPPNRFWTFSSGVDVEISSDISVYLCKKNGDDIETTMLTEEQLNVGGRRVIKANNGVLLAGTAGNAYELIARKNSGISIVDATKDAKSYGVDNALVPAIVAMHFTPSDFMMLYKGEFIGIANDDTKAPACKALLKK